MDKSKVPTRDIVLGTGEEQVKVKVYKWLIQEEDDQYQTILVGESMDLDMESGDKTANTIRTKIGFSSYAAARKYLVETMCINLSWDDFNILSPDMRDELFTKLDVLRVIKKKSSPERTS